jgi:hypothetical protein
MSDESLADYLNDINASSDVVEQALRYYLAQRTDDLPPEEMREQFLAESADPKRLEQQLALLEGASDQIEEAALTYLSAAWADEEERDAIRNALQQANKSLPVVEIVVLTTLVMYAMYLLATRGKSREIRRTHRGPDGSFTEETETVYANPAPWLNGIFGLFHRQDDPPQP